MKNISALTRKAENEFRNMIPYTPRTGGQGMFSNANGVAAPAYSKLNSNNRTLTFEITNANTASAKTARLFGSVKDLTDANLDSDITVDVKESSHTQLKAELLSAPVRILGARLLVSNSATQFNNALLIYDEDTTGRQEKFTVQPNNWRSAQNNLEKQIDSLNFEVIVNKNVYVDVSINASETLTLIFYISEKFEDKNILIGKPAVAAVDQLAPTGLPQIDMLG